MKQITKYQSEDGKVFDTPEEALQRDLRYKIELFCESNGSYHINNHSENVAEFIIENFAQIKKIIEGKL